MKKKILNFFINFKRMNPANSKNGFSTYRLNMNRRNFAEIEFNSYCMRLGFIAYSSKKNLAILIEKLKEICIKSGRNAIFFADSLEENVVSDLEGLGFVETKTSDRYNHYLTLEIAD